MIDEVPSKVILNVAYHHQK